MTILDDRSQDRLAKIISKFEPKNIDIDNIKIKS